MSTPSPGAEAGPDRDPGLALEQPENPELDRAKHDAILAAVTASEKHALVLVAAALSDGNMSRTEMRSAYYHTIGDGENSTQESASIHFGYIEHRFEPAGIGRTFYELRHLKNGRSRDVLVAHIDPSDPDTRTALAMAGAGLVWSREEDSRAAKDPDDYALSLADVLGYSKAKQGRLGRNTFSRHAIARLLSSNASRKEVAEAVGISANDVNYYVGSLIDNEVVHVESSQDWSQRVFTFTGEPSITSLVRDRRTTSAELVVVADLVDGLAQAGAAEISAEHLFDLAAAAASAKGIAIDNARLTTIIREAMHGRSKRADGTEVKRMPSLSGGGPVKSGDRSRTVFSLNEKHRGNLSRLMWRLDAIDSGNEEVIQAMVHQAYEIALNPEIAKQLANKAETATAYSRNIRIETIHPHLQAIVLAEGPLSFRALSRALRVAGIGQSPDTLKLLAKRHPDVIRTEDLEMSSHGEASSIHVVGVDALPDPSDVDLPA